MYVRSNKFNTVHEMVVDMQQSYNEQGTKFSLFHCCSAMSKRPKFRYEPQQMEAALQDVRENGLAIKQAASKHGVPRMTLSDKLKGNTPEGRKMGPQTWLTEDEEKMLVEWALTLCKAGFPLTMEDLQNSVQQLTKELQRNFPFTDGRPGRTWCTAFLTRHPTLTLRTPQNLTASRAAVTQTRIREWYQEVFSYLQENHLEDVLSEPKRIFNGDESAFFLNPKGSKVLAKKGDKCIFQQVNCDEKECITVLVTGNAAGDLCPPLLCLKYERLPQEIVAGVPPEWGVGKSPNGWMTGQVFYEYLTNIFHPWLVTNKITLPVILFMDGHSSHLTLHTSNFCKNNGIVLVALLPNSTHILQPMDVGVFRPLKSGWKTAVHDHRLQRVAAQEDPTLRKRDFARLLKTVIEKTISPQILQQAFRKCGLFPWDPSAVEVEKLIARPRSTSATSTVSSTSPAPRTPDSNAVADSAQCCALVESLLGGVKVKRFEESGDVWQGAVEDTNLFVLWRQLRSSSCGDNSPIGQTETPHGSQLQDTRPTGDMQSSYEDGLPATVAVTAEDPATEDTASGTSTILATVTEDTASCSATVPATVTMGTASVSTADIPSAVPSTSTIEPVSRANPMPSPFKRVLFWPSQTAKVKKGKAREKIPSVASSDEWTTYFTKKEQAKQELQRQKEERAAERIRKRAAKEISLSQKSKKRRPVTSSSSSDDEIFPLASSDEWSDDHDEQCVEVESVTTTNVQPGSFVLATFLGGKRATTKFRFVCVVQAIDGDDVQVMGMRSHEGRKSIFVTKDTDVCYITMSQINGVLPTPNMKQLGARIHYCFPGLVDVHEL